MGHFWVAMLEVRGLELVVAISALLRGLRVGGFFDSLSKSFLHDLLELQSHFEKYINAKEAMAEKKERRECKHPYESYRLPPQPKKRSDEVRSRHRIRGP